ncbi:MAG: STAS domain-containing protein [Planctomycetota bacterium]|jgi:anti-anti-sigma regulatory factor
MAIENLSDDIVLVDLPSEGSARAGELKKVNEIIGKNCNCHVVVDLSKVEIIHSWNISNLLILRTLLQDAGRQLILCSVTVVTRCIFTVAGLSDVFVFADDRSAALKMIRNSKSPASTKS